jgi:simple sugar transport system ATP-binding protein
VPEQRKVHELVGALKRQNVPVLLISHNLQDIFAVSDRIIVMRRGQKVGDMRTAQVTDDDLVAMMVGST